MANIPRVPETISYAASVRMTALEYAVKVTPPIPNAKVAIRIAKEFEKYILTGELDEAQ